MPQAPSLRTDPFFTISILHLPTSKTVDFEGWVTEFNDAYSSNWSSTPVYGRMDPLPAFENTQRTISLTFDVVSDSIEDAVINLKRVNELIEFQYPLYESGDRTAQNTLKAAPLMGVKWTNLINNSAKSGYLYGYMNGGVSYNPAIADGGFIIKSPAVFNDLTTGKVPASNVNAGARTGGGVTNINKLPTLPVGNATNSSQRTPGGDTIQGQYTIKGPKSAYIPKTLSISFTFNVLHTHLQGWSATRDSANFGGTKKDLTSQFPNATMIQNQRTILTEETAEGEIQEVTADVQFTTNQALVLESN